MLSRSILLITIATVAVFAASSGESLVKTNGCMECHNLRGPNKAPGFAGIGMRAKREQGGNASNYLSNIIKNGSKTSGRWPRFRTLDMPANNISDADRATIASWMLTFKPLYRGRAAKFNR